MRVSWNWHISKYDVSYDLFIDTFYQVKFLTISSLSVFNHRRNSGYCQMLFLHLLRKCKSFIFILLVYSILHWLSSFPSHVILILVSTTGCMLSFSLPKPRNWASEKGFWHCSSEAFLLGPVPSNRWVMELILTCRMIEHNHRSHLKVLLWSSTHPRQVWYVY